MPRQFVAIATTNDEKFLKDPTGNRRFWPIRCVKIDLEALKADREQIWAEAAHLEVQGVSIDLPPEYYAEAAGLQQAHMIENQYVDKLRLELGDETGKIPATYVYEMLGLSPEKQQQYTTEAISRAMKERGWDKKQLRYKKEKVICFVRGETDEERGREIETTMCTRTRKLKIVPEREHCFTRAARLAGC